MAKRRVIDIESEVESSSSEYSPPSTARQPTSRKRRKRKEPEGATRVEHPDTDTTREYCPSHAASVHQIQSAASTCRALLQWYTGVSESRGMPWRKPYDPSLSIDARAQRAYEVWISEIMLQQTQVATVIPYYNRWMEKFPTIRDLAAASIDEVNSLWKGLGYYSRASRLLSGAQKTVKDFNGRLPDNAKDMEAHIPGIGRYSAGAICSIAYGEVVPVLDGNVHRLLSRFLALHAQPKAKATLNILWSAANDILTTGARSTENPAIGYPGDVNQALIELGSTICKVRDPNCEECPLRDQCAGYLWSSASKTASDDIPDIEELCTICEPLERGSGVLAFPMKVERKKAREELDLVNVIEWRSKSQQRMFLLVKRPENGLLAGLYEFPTLANVTASISNSTSTESLLSMYLSSKVYLRVDAGSADSESYHIVNTKPVGDVIHVFSHIKKTYRVQWVLLEGCSEPPFPTPLNDDKSTKTPSRRAKQPRSESTQRSSGTAWFDMNEVAEANIGTGVRKVWELTKRLWE
ncbi:hypothetical protein PLEOSDRAFT_35925 [Pleurotus ostreatus PC15]|uniref:Adenine DNA glycosylase n=1 Tax=Pleurotus ostreatus (strain PC15) TaxID=1137138 RepID=A0A067NE68_PLEO1|nr:hypothetical protein PLEOSDRAFT_35925 [Pleurotus ostreatus PC15]